MQELCFPAGAAHDEKPVLIKVSPFTETRTCHLTLAIVSVLEHTLGRLDSDFLLMLAEVQCIMGYLALGILPRMGTPGNPELNFPIHP